MKRPLLLLLAVPLAFACGERNPENSAECGFAILGAANAVRQQMQNGSKVLTSVPPDMGTRIATRAPGYGTTPAVVAESPDGPIVAYEGPGFPATPGFGVILVEDSTDTFQGVLVMDLDPPGMGYPVLGGVTNGSYMIPLYGLRVSWGAVSTPNCPLFAPIDTSEASTS
ncbi:MAG: hypothetical protein PVH40_04870 [Gemmatimonadales bacterium]|jgi:hypothetical protein